MADVVLFDVNETLLDTRALDPWFERHFGEAAARERWFMQLEILWLVTLATGEYQDFATLADAAVRMRAEKEDAAVSDHDRKELLDQMKRLPPHGDAAGALQRLDGAGLRLAALTNGTLDAARRQLGNAGLDEHFEGVFSADEVERFKPAPEPYAMALERLGVEPREAWMVAAHAWDLAGARAAGLEDRLRRACRKGAESGGPAAGRRRGGPAGAE
jgi:2-haloacid dehalogenase